MASTDQPNNTKIAAIEAELNTCMQQLHAIEEVNTQYITTATSHALLGADVMNHDGMSQTIKICGKHVKINIEQHTVDEIVTKSIKEEDIIAKSIKIAGDTRPPSKILDTDSAKKRIFDFIENLKAFKDWVRDFQPEFFTFCTFQNICIKSIDIFVSVSRENGFMKFETDLKYTTEYQTEYMNRALKSKEKEIHRAYMNQIICSNNMLATCDGFLVK